MEVHVFRRLWSVSRQFVIILKVVCIENTERNTIRIERVIHKVRMFACSFNIANETKNKYLFIFVLPSISMGIYGRNLVIQTRLSFFFHIYWFTFELRYDQVST